MADDITSAELEKALDVVEAFIGQKRPIEDKDITAPRLAKRLGKRTQNVKPELERMVIAGKLICVGKVRQEDGRPVTAYRLALGIASKLKQKEDGVL